MERCNAADGWKSARAVPEEGGTFAVLYVGPPPPGYPRCGAESTVRLLVEPNGFRGLEFVVRHLCERHALDREAQARKTGMLTRRVLGDA